MPSANYLPEVLETTEAERLATGFTFPEGPTWHPDGYWYFVDLRQNKLFRLGRLIMREGDDRRLTRMTADLVSLVIELRYGAVRRVRAAFAKADMRHGNIRRH